MRNELLALHCSVKPGVHAPPMSTSEPLEMIDVLSDSDAGSGSEMDEETGLTKRERRQKKRQHDQLDVRIGEHIPVSKHEARLADRDVVKKLLVNSVLILLWYFFSLAISIVNLSRRSATRTALTNI
jgi:hypothetical protein